MLNNHNVSTRIIRSLSHDPWYNLALEEHLLHQVNENQIILYLWQNENTVVIGKNQNAWKECKWKELESDGGKLARRLSGGGAVFHDLGNLNFTFVMDEKLYNLEKQTRVILNGVNKLGIKAEFSGRNDITVEGRKFSGNAFYFEDKFAYHHGTILVNADISKMTEYLQVSKEKIVSKGIDSVKSRVINLASLNNNVTLEKVIKALKESFIELYGGELDEIQADKVTDEIKELYHKYASWEWKYGETPKFEISFDHRFTWGGIEICLNLHNGIISSTQVYSDAMDSKLIQEIADVLNGVPFNLESIIIQLETIDTSAEGQNIIGDIKKWLREKQI